MRFTTVVLALLLAASTLVAQSVPPAIFTDPPTDAAHPPKMTVLHILSHGLLINGLVYQPSGAGLHPTLVICHGWPGNEKNLDLAQAVRRAGWNAVTFNYRGSWGSPGNFHFAQNIEDAAAVLAFLRDAVNAEKLGIDIHRIVIAGHSMGGWVVAHAASRDRALLGAILISAADLGRGTESNGDTKIVRDKLVAMSAENMETLTGATPESLADEIISHAREFQFDNTVAGLSQLPLLVISSDDGLAPDTDALIAAIKARGGTKLSSIHMPTDHSYSDHRIALESAILSWLSTLH